MIHQANGVVAPARPLGLVGVAALVGVTCAVLSGLPLLMVAGVAATASFVTSCWRRDRAEVRRVALWALHAPQGLMDDQDVESCLSAQLAVLAAGDVTLLSHAAVQVGVAERDVWAVALAEERLAAAASKCSSVAVDDSRPSAWATAVVGLACAGLAFRGGPVVLLATVAVLTVSSSFARRAELVGVTGRLCELALSPRLAPSCECPSPSPRLRSSTCSSTSLVGSGPSCDVRRTSQGAHRPRRPRVRCPDSPPPRHASSEPRQGAVRDDNAKGRWCASIMEWRAFLMTEIQETRLPGVGVRHEFTTAGGERVAVLTHRNGRREVAVFNRADPDASRTVLHLSAADTRSLAELLGAGQVSEAVGAVQHQLEGLAIDWITVPGTSPAAGSTIAEGQLRTRTGASVVALIRSGSTVPAPGSEQRLDAGDVVVAVGTPEGLAQLRELLGA